MTIIFQLRNKAILSKMLSSEIAGLKTTKEDFFWLEEIVIVVLFS